MKNKHHILPCGRLVRFKLYNHVDVVNSAISKALLNNRVELEKFVKYKHAGTKKRWVEHTLSKMSKIIMSKLVDHLMESDRVETSSGKLWHIAGKSADTKYLNWHTDGLVYSVCIKGLPGNFRIRMARKRRMELLDRINKGQNFHVYE